MEDGVFVPSVRLHVLINVLSHLISFIIEALNISIRQKIYSHSTEVNNSFPKRWAPWMGFGFLLLLLTFLSDHVNFAQSSI